MLPSSSNNSRQQTIIVKRSKIEEKRILGEAVKLQQQEISRRKDITKRRHENILQTAGKNTQIYLAVQTAKNEYFKVWNIFLE